jgi:organic hydroperoxide reductase OsmC/OhrA
MSQHKIAVHWQNTRTDFQYDTYDRTHSVRWEGGQETRASSAKEYLGNGDLANPEEMLAAALASCHMLTFLAVAAKSRLHLKSYSDNAVAHLEKGENGIMCITRVDLYPVAEFLEAVDPEQLKKLHEKAHKHCFIANSVRSQVQVHLP